MTKPKVIYPETVKQVSAVLILSKCIQRFAVQVQTGQTLTEKEQQSLGDAFEICMDAFFEVADDLGLPDINHTTQVFFED